MCSARRAFLAAAVLIVAASGAACGGTSSDEPAVEPSTPSSSSEPGTVAGQFSAEAFDAAWNDRLALSAEFDRTVVTALVEAAGLSEQLGADADDIVSALLESSTAAIRDEWSARGIDPAGAEAALSVPPAPVASFRSAAASPASGASVGMLALVTSIMSTYEPVFSQQPDPATGRIVDRVTPRAARASSQGLAITLDQTADVDLAMCPDIAGIAEGVVTIDADLLATGTIDGEAVTLRASATYGITTTVQSDARGRLASTTGLLTGTILSSGTDGDTSRTDSDGIGATIPYGEDGASVKDGIEGHGTTFGSGSTIEDMTKTLMVVATTLGVVHGQAALSYWTSGKCVRLETAEPLAPLVGEVTTIDVRAVHQIDGADVQGTLTVTPATGTFDPLESDVPAAIRVVPDEGAASAMARVELRSLRGVAATDIAVEAHGFHVALGDAITISGEKCDGYVGLWPLVFAGMVTEQGVTIVFDGTLDVTVNSDLSASYTIDLRGEAEGLPVVSAALSFVGGGAAVFVDDPDVPRIDLLDGELSTIADGSGPGASISGVVQQGPAGHASIPVMRSACATPGG